MRDAMMITKTPHASRASTRTKRARPVPLQKRTGARWPSRTKKVMSAAVLSWRVSMNGVASYLPNENAESGKHHLSSLVKPADLNTLWSPRMSVSGIEKISSVQRHRVSALGSVGLQQRGVRPSALMAEQRVTHATGTTASAHHVQRPVAAGHTSLRLVPSVRRGSYRAVGRARTRSTATMSPGIVVG